MSEIPDTLARRLSTGAIPVGEALRCAIVLANALREVHSRGRVYGSLHPECLPLIEGEVRLPPSGPATLSAYFSPEQVAGNQLSPRSDIFALGAVIYEMLSGQAAFAAPTKAALRVEILERQPAPLEDVPPDLARLVLRCLEKKPERRIQRMEILLAELKLQQILVRGTQATPHAIAIESAPARPKPLPVVTFIRPDVPATPEAGLAPVVLAPVLKKRNFACPMCGSREVHDSRPQGSFESALLRAHVSINRCHRCYHRFVRAAGISIRKPGSPRIGCGRPASPHTPTPLRSGRAATVHRAYCQPPPSAR